MNAYQKFFVFVTMTALATILGGCSAFTDKGSSPAGDYQPVAADYDYHIAPGDVLNIFVWRNPEVSSSGIPVRPDGRISAPLIDSMEASGKTPAQLAGEIEAILGEYIKDPFVTVTVTGIIGGFNQQIRVIGEVTKPSALPYSENMTLLDVMIAVGGLTEYASGNKASIVRKHDGKEDNFIVRLDDLLKGGDISANVSMHPGDIVIVPESLF
ncbi:MAG: XrtA-associated exopolysaccharide export protein, Rfer_0658/Tmz1t_3282 family [Gammaproteobacteria bacterium]|nr:XrtA-associated exopolysaccharide export protein, Rfer_0658/Tmz1t_3282 family [Gammaproteobacteria bacterium]